jgi:hypothetical protein
MSVYKRYCWVCWYGKRCIRTGLEGSFNKATNWAGITGVAAIGLLFQRIGRQIMPAETWTETLAQALLYLAGAWVVIFVGRVLYAPFVIYREGDWYGPKFIYKEKKFAFREYVSPADNNKIFKFKFPDAEPFSMISYKIELEGRSDLLSTFVASHPNQLPTFSSEKDMQYTGGTITVDRECNMCMKVFMREDADAFAVRIYVTGYERVQDGKPREDTRKAEFEPARWG